MKHSRFLAYALAALAALGAASGCGRSDFLLLDHVEDAGDSGTDAGGGTGPAGTGPGGTGPAGTGAGGSFTGGTGFGGSFTGGTGTGGTGGCLTGFTSCGGLCVNTSTDHENCGACFTHCPSDAACSNGSCVTICGDGLSYCFGLCTDISSDPANCGRCGIVCGTGASCQNGTCTPGCLPPFRDCGGGVCSDLRSDRRNCGACNVACSHVDETCVNGRCECPGREMVCGARCADLQTDPANCGRCGVVCASNTICADGACRLNCPPEFSDCNGECRNLETDPDHCGSCDNSCPRAQVCSAGECDTSCGNLTACNGFCRDLQHDPGHCGSCSTACSPDEICSNGTCALVCGPGITNCNGTCRDLRVDPANCGTCGHACSMRQICRTGTCVDVTTTLYSVSPSPAAFVDACSQPGTFSVVPNVDDFAQQLMLPWAFPFYGNSTQAAWVSSNGVLGFGTPSAIYINECALGSLPRAIFAFWDDLVTRTRGVCIATVGVQPNRTFVATWSDVYILSGGTSSSLTFSIQLNENGSTIDVLYATMSGGGTLSTGTSASIGLASDAAYTLDCCNSACVMSNTGRRYTPVFR